MVYGYFYNVLCKSCGHSNKEITRLQITDTTLVCSICGSKSFNYSTPCEIGERSGIPYEALGFKVVNGNLVRIKKKKVNSKRKKNGRS